nr:hypothetical protein B0A51_09734 [Rachicladosporium sp. CCFEE 5018]
MPSDVPWIVSVRDHPGSSAEDIHHEPNWTNGHQHRVGYRNDQGRLPGLTHDTDEASDVPDLASPSSGLESEDEQKFDEDARKRFQELKSRAKKGDLINFRDVIKNQEDFHLRHPQDRSLGWRFVFEATEDWSKEKNESQDNTNAQTVDRTKESAEKPSPEDTGQEENDWKRKQGENHKHNDAYATGEEKSDSEAQATAEYETLLERYTPQEIALLKALRHEKDYRYGLQQNDGKRESPQTYNRSTISIDEQDQFTPDNWLPRSGDLIRLTGKHPLNAEAHLSKLFDGGLITPNELHYVRNHGAVPRILWEFHELDIEDGKLVLSMDDVKRNFEHVNIAVALACDGNRRKEMNMVRRSKGFDWGSGATGCAYWKGPLLRDVLLAAGISPGRYTGEGKLRWVNFEGADDPSEGKYATCIPLDYAMDPSNDVLLALYMNDVPLPPDHGYPIRVIIPGYVGGRCVKWLKRIWVTDYENQSHYHIWDNRVLPSFITEKDGEFANAMFAHPDTACNEQNLNSVIVKPAQGEQISLAKAKRGSTYRIEGYAYDGGGHEVQRVELSLDEGQTWLYCIRKFPDYPIRHGNKFWTWLHWYVDVSIVHLLQSRSMSVRAWNVFKNTQPEKLSWNTMGMMNNCWYVVKPEIQQGKDEEVPYMRFRHPVEPGSRKGGWMKPSVENQIAGAKRDAGAPQKQFTRQEIEKHSIENDCWLVVDNKVYDCTSVLTWHPGGRAAVLGHAGKVHQETSDEFAGIHDGFAYQKLKECILGVVTDKAANFIKANAEAAAEEKAQDSQIDGDVVLQKHRWVPVKLMDRESLSEDTRKYTFGLPDGAKDLGLGTCQHVQLGFHLKDRMLIRSYTPTRPLLPDPEKSDERKTLTNGANASGEVSKMQDGQGTFELVVKTYFPTSEQPGGAMSNLLDCMPLGEEVEIRGPTGEIVYHGNGQFTISGQDMIFTKISLVLGGSGITPGYALIARALLGQDKNVQLRVLDANKSEKDILLKVELDQFEKDSKGGLQVTHILSHPSDDWKGLKGHVSADIIRDKLFAPEEGSVVFLCGPPAMIQKAALPALRDWGYEEDKNVFGF